MTALSTRAWIAALPKMSVQGTSPDARALLAFWSSKLKRLIWVVLKFAGTWLLRRFASLQSYNSLHQVVAGGLLHGRSCQSSVDNWSRATLRPRPHFSRSGPHEIVDTAASYPHFTFFRENVGNIPIRPTLATKLLYEFEVWFEA